MYRKEKKSTMISKSDFSLEERINCKPENCRGILGLKVVAGPIDHKRIVNKKGS